MKTCQESDESNLVYCGLEGILCLYKSQVSIDNKNLCNLTGRVPCPIKIFKNLYTNLNISKYNE